MMKYGYTILLSLLLSIQALVAQSFISFPFSGYDEYATIQIGFKYSYINQNYQLTLKDNWKQLFEDLDIDQQSIAFIGELKSIRSKSASGFSVGIPIDVKWSDKISLNFIPSFNILNSHKLAYVPMDSEKDVVIRKTKQVLNDIRGDNHNSFELPITLKFRSEEKKISSLDTKYRGYQLGGVRLTRWAGIIDQYADLKIEKLNNRPIPEGLILKPEFISWEAGIGFDFYLTHFKVSPEVRFSQSVNNVLSNNHVLSTDNKFMAPIDRALIRNVYFSLIFQ